MVVTALPIRSQDLLVLQLEVVPFYRPLAIPGSHCPDLVSRGLTFFRRARRSDTIHCLSSSVWLISLGIMPARVTGDAANGGISFLRVLRAIESALIPGDPTNE